MSINLDMYLEIFEDEQEELGEIFISFDYFHHLLNMNKNTMYSLYQNHYPKHFRNKLGI